MFMKRYVLVLSICVVSGLLSAETAAQSGPDESVDNRSYADLLKKYVSSGRVDYHGFKSAEAVLDRYLKMLGHINPKALSRKDQFAFYINAYNAYTLKLILTEYPGIESIRDIGGLFGSPWKKKICRINGQNLSLDEIENEILRPRFQDSRVHFAINCASKGCPPLRSEPYEGRLLEQQLDDAARRFVNNSGYNRLEGHTLFVSMIFKWYADDFENDVIGVFLKYADTNLHNQLKVNREKIKLKYLDYDWSLNGK